MNMMAHQVVALERALAAPRGPKAVWLPAPPKAPARSAALPLCKSTTMISTRQLITKNAGKIKKKKRLFDSFQPKATIPRPTARAMLHFIQLGICMRESSREIEEFSSGAKARLTAIRTLGLKPRPPKRHYRNRRISQNLRWPRTILRPGL